MVKNILKMVINRLSLLSNIVKLYDNQSCGSRIVDKINRTNKYNNFICKKERILNLRRKGELAIWKIRPN